MMGSKKITLSCYYIHGILSTLLLFASLGSTFQQQKVANNGKRRYHRWYPLQYRIMTDPLIIASNRQYLHDVLGFSEEKLDKLEDPSYACNILTLDIGILDERAKWLKIRLSSTDNEIKKMIQSQPTILGRPSESDTGLASKIDYLQNRLLLENISVKKLIQRLPSILGMSISENMEPKLDWLQQRLSLTDDDLSKMIQRLPALFAYNIHTNMEPKLDWLQQRLSLTDEQLSKVLQRLPSLFCYNIHANIEPKLDWIQQRLALTDDELSKTIQRLPSLFCFNISNNLEPTLSFYINALGDESEALTFVTNNPASFGYSLDKRLKPRLEEAQSIGMKIDYTCLHYIVKDTSDQWNERVIMCVANELCRY